MLHFRSAAVGNLLGKIVHLDDEDRHVLIMCGMSAAFAALFGTPMAAAVFSMEWSVSASCIIPH